ncbi:SGNH/GDSL hydrolase family protein [Microbacterium sp. P03]|uniref:SGNH/GDSL hydrolase family protein n=1 Tax=Microbacterium sp. P03 TaxID=3366946 RepID=UPI00374527BA
MAQPARLMGGAGRRVAVSTALIGLSLAMGGCATAGASSGATPSSDAASPSRSSTSPPAQTPSPSLSIVVVGDSNSTGFNGTLERGMADGTAWAALLPVPEDTTVGGWAMDGATTAAMLQGIVAAPATDADALVVMGGTNDLGQGVAPEAVLQNIEQIVAQVNASCVVLSAIAPFDPLAMQAVDLNASFADLANARGWVFVDPWSAARQSDGTWLPALRTDGIHTSPEGYALAATAIGTALSEC